MQIEEILQAVALCDYPDYEFVVVLAPEGVLYVEARYEEADTVTGKIEQQTTRPWLITAQMTKSEIVATCFKCILTSMEHRAREWFIYNGAAIYQPHYDVDRLHAIAVASH